jgi:cytochrome c2
MIAVLAGLAVLGVGVAMVTTVKRSREREAQAVALTQGDPVRGRAHLLRYGCAGCHVIPGVREPSGRVGPSLEDVARRVYIGGVVTNTPDHMIDWIVDPRALSPRTAMPVTGISRSEARDVAAYLYAH